MRIGNHFVQGGVGTPLGEVAISAPDFGANMPFLDSVVIPLDNARTMDILPIGGTCLWASRSTSRGALLTVHFNEQGNQGIPFTAGMAITAMRYGRLYVSNDAQAGETITLTYGNVPANFLNPADLPGNVDVSNITLDSSWHRDVDLERQFWSSFNMGPTVGQYPHGGLLAGAGITCYATRLLVTSDTTQALRLARHDAALSWASTETNMRTGSAAPVSTVSGETNAALQGTLFGNGGAISLLADTPTELIKAPWRMDAAEGILVAGETVNTRLRGIFEWNEVA